MIPSDIKAIYNLVLKKKLKIVSYTWNGEENAYYVAAVNPETRQMEYWSILRPPKNNQRNHNTIQGPLE